MPELPEVETIRRSLEEHIIGRTIQNLEIRWPSACKDWKGYDFAETLSGLKFMTTDRRGKYLLLHLSGGWTLIAHMRMTGRLNYYPDAREPEKHTHLVFYLDRGQLQFTDTRKFGRVQLVPTDSHENHPSLRILGPEPLAPQFTHETLAERLANKKKNLKGALLDQTVLAGLGNIYTDEALFLAGLSPEKPVNSLAAEEIRGLHQAIQTVLERGIAAQGTSFRDYRDANGEKGSFQESLKVYGRAYQACYTCGSVLVRKQVAGRTTVYCPHCQKE